MRLKRPEGINIVPFIDVMLVLLAIVLAVSTFIAQGKIKVELPQAASIAKEQNNSKNIEITIDKDDKIYIDNAELTLNELQEKISLLQISDKIIIIGDNASNFGRFIEVIDMLKMKGCDNIQIAAKQDEQ